MASNKLLRDFPPVTTEAWETLINKDLKGADYDKKLVWKPAAGLAVRPYYRADDLQNIEHTRSNVGEFPYVRGTRPNNHWRIQQSYCACADVRQANARALEGIAKGVEAVSFCVSRDITEADLRLLLGGICGAASVNLEACGGCGIGLVSRAAAALKGLGIDLNNVRFSVDANPLKMLTLTGNLNKDAFDKLAEAAKAAEGIKNFCSIGVSGAVLHNAGASVVEELAFALNMGSEYLAQLADRGIKAGSIASRIRFTFAVGANYFLEIAKIRAARLLWANVASAYAPDDERSAAMNIHAVTSAWNQTAYDAYVNMLRGTSEAMSAAIAGADSLEVLRFDQPFRQTSGFAERIARNTQIILKEEARFDHVADPAAGSYYIEALTQSLAQEAWKLFKEVEEEGGYITAFREGFIQEKVRASAEKRNANLASRREILVGVNQYPNFTETAGKETAQALKGSRCSCGCECKGSEGCCGCGCEKIGEPLVQYRGSQAFEDLRLRTEAAAGQPQAFMLTFGNLAMCRARAQFACNFFAVAGFKVTDNNSFASIPDGIQAALDAKAEIVVACSSDEEYADAVPQIAAGLGGKAIVVVAGDPPCKADLQSRGISHFISVKSNVLDTLKEYQRELGI